MTSIDEQIRFTVEEYLEMERQSPERHEYLDGFVYAMAGESPNHGTISINLISEVRLQLKDSPCQGWAKDCKVRSGPAAEPVGGAASTHIPIWSSFIDFSVADEPKAGEEPPEG
ncbi:MAG: Uma2 family endonuclease [Blastocatellia bacterium]